MPRAVKSEEAAPAVSNTALWDELAVTDPRFTKAFTKGGGFKGTDINPTWRFKRLTEAFGPCGKGWGWEIVERWSEQIDGKTYCYVALQLWWTDGTMGQDYPVRHVVGPHIGGTEMTRQADEAYKMAVTDAIGKCCNALGLSADIYMGQFDDSKYRDAAATVTQAGGVEQIVQPILDAIGQAPSTDALTELWQTHKARIDNLKIVNPAQHLAITDAFRARKAILS